MLENTFVRGGVFFLVGFTVPVVLGVLLSDVDGGIQIGVVMGIVWAVLSQFFQPKPSLAD
jgi:hypothetical protein